MSFWLATLNPGKTRRRGRRRRKLTAWQRAVKRHGGVMQAVRAARKSKRSRRGRRRNPFLTAVAARAAFPAPNARKRRRKLRRTRRSAFSRRSLRGRSRRAKRRSKMARKTRRRRHLPRRGRGGRFVSRRSRRGGRRRRRNPVLPVSWNPRRRRRRSRRNPLFRSRISGRFKGRAPGRRLHRRRRRPHYWHNAVVPVSWNPRRRRHRRSYRRNSILPISWNPGIALGGRGGLIGATFGRLGTFIDIKFWTETGIPAASGFFMSKAIGSFLTDLVAKTVSIPSQIAPFARIAADALGGGLLAWATGNFYSKKAADAVWLGTVVNVAHAVLKRVLGGTAIAKTIGLEGLGDDLADRMKSAIAERVNASLRGMNGLGTYLTYPQTRFQGNGNGVGEYFTERQARIQTGYAPGPAGDLRDYDVTNQEVGI